MINKKYREDRNGHGGDGHLGILRPPSDPEIILLEKTETLD
jgi:hypothetical protein